MAPTTMRSLLEAGVHFGHQAKRWNPKMKKYIFTVRNDIHVIDLQKTMKYLTEAYDAVKSNAAQGGKILFVGTKKQAQDAIKEEAERCDMFYVNHRWLGGMLTNYDTVRKSISKFKKIEKMAEDGTFDKLPAKEVSKLTKTKDKLEANLAGIKEMGGSLPDMMFVVDTKNEQIAIAEAQRLGIPIVGVVDTNCDPDGIAYPIPANDDAIRAIKLLSSVIADAVLAGKKELIGEDDSVEQEMIASSEEAPVEEAVAVEA